VTKSNIFHSIKVPGAPKTLITVQQRLTEVIIYLLHFCSVVSKMRLEAERSTFIKYVTQKHYTIKGLKSDVK